jgi:hypothetical protein
MLRAVNDKGIEPERGIPPHEKWTTAEALIP